MVAGVPMLSHWNAWADCCDPDKDRNASVLPNSRGIVAVGGSARSRPPPRFWRALIVVGATSVLLWLLIGWGLSELWTVLQ
jgi:hypothetical protein